MSPVTSKSTRNVLKLLEASRRGHAESEPPIMEELRRCPEAFQAGQILGKAFDSLKYGPEETADGDRILPPPGTVIPPFA